MLERPGNLDELTVRVEARPGTTGREPLGRLLTDHIKSRIGVAARVEVVDPGALERSLGRAPPDRRPAPAPTGPAMDRTGSPSSWAYFGSTRLGWSSGSSSTQSSAMWAGSSSSSPSTALDALDLDPCDVGRVLVLARWMRSLGTVRRRAPGALHPHGRSPTVVQPCPERPEGVLTDGHSARTREVRDAAAGVEREAGTPVRAHQGRSGRARRSEDKAEEIAARTVNKERARQGEARSPAEPPRRTSPRGRRGGLRSHPAPADARATSSTTRPRRKGIEGRSKMNKAQLERAVGR